MTFKILGQAVEGVFSLHNFCTQICGQHGEIERMQCHSQCKEIKDLKLLREKDSNSTWVL